MTHFPDGLPAFIPLQRKEDDPRKFKIYRNQRGSPRWYQRWIEAWWIVTGSWSLHRAWQNGMDYGQRIEWTRIITNMGDIEAQRRNVEIADKNLALARNR